MRKASILLVAFLLISPSIKLRPQSVASDRQENAVKDRQVQGPSPTHPTFRPKLSLQDALQIAQTYIDKEHIDISSYWLYRAMFILYGDSKTPDKDKLPCWHFWWVTNSGDMGDYVEILVAMDGKAWRIPSM